MEISDFLVKVKKQFPLPSFEDFSLKEFVTSLPYHDDIQLMHGSLQIYKQNEKDQFFIYSLDSLFDLIPGVDNHQFDPEWELETYLKHSKPSKLTSLFTHRNEEKSLKSKFLSFLFYNY